LCGAILQGPSGAGLEVLYIFAAGCAHARHYQPCREAAATGGCSREINKKAKGRGVERKCGGNAAFLFSPLLCFLLFSFSFIFFSFIFFSFVELLLQ